MSKRKRPRPEPETLGLPRVGVDSHAHLDGEEFRPEEIPDVLARAGTAGLAQVGNVFLGPAAFAAHKALFDAHPEVFFILGVHPCDAAGVAPDDLSALEAAFRGEPRLRALGEIGLDYYWDSAPRDVQLSVFKDQLALARERDLPVVIHSRAAEPDTLAVLDAMGFRDRPLVWHCFGGGPDLLGAVASRGFHVSVPGPVTYAKNVDLAAAVAAMDTQRLLIETDAPYLAPEPWRGKRNEPALVAFTAARVAALLGLAPEKLWRLAGDNARAFFGL